MTLEDPRFQIDTRAGFGHALRSVGPFAPGEVLVAFAARERHRRPAQMTLQVSEEEHVELSPDFLRFINHACEPNVLFDVERWALVALSAIAPGDELTFFYPATEWAVASPFDCACGSLRCLKAIGGASLARPGELDGHVLAPHVRRLLGRPELSPPRRSAIQR